MGQAPIYINILLLSKGLHHEETILKIKLEAQIRKHNLV